MLHSRAVYVAGQPVRFPLTVHLIGLGDATPAAPCAAQVLDATGRVLRVETPSIADVVQGEAEVAVHERAQAYAASLEAVLHDVQRVRPAVQEEDPVAASPAAPSVSAAPVWGGAILGALVALLLELLFGGAERGTTALFAGFSLGLWGSGALYVVGMRRAWWPPLLAEPGEAEALAEAETVRGSTLVDAIGDRGLLVAVMLAALIGVGVNTQALLHGPDPWHALAAGAGCGAWAAGTLTLLRLGVGAPPPAGPTGHPAPRTWREIVTGVPALLALRRPSAPGAVARRSDQLEGRRDEAPRVRPRA